MGTKLNTPLGWAETVAKTLMRQYRAEDLRAEWAYVDDSGRTRLSVLIHPEEFITFVGKAWRYNHGLMMVAFQRLSEATGFKGYYDYTKVWASQRVAPDGYIELLDEIDAIQPGLALFTLYEKEGEERYLKGIEHIKRALDNVPRTKEGGYWHKNNTPDQMWLDGLYMVEPFVIKYAKLKGDTSCYESVAHQARLMTKYTKDEKTGLLYHGYDERRVEPWADKETGRSSVFWCRAMGWYCVALVDILEEMPKDMPEYKELFDYFKSALDAVIKVKDEKTGLWYQVLDRADDPRNWLELSSSCLFLYSICKAVRIGLLPDSYLDGIEKTYDSIIDFIEYDDEGEVALEGTCRGTNVGEYEFYLTRGKITNDFHGAGAFIMAMVEYSMKK